MYLLSRRLKMIKQYNYGAPLHSGVAVKSKVFAQIGDRLRIFNQKKHYQIKSACIKYEAWKMKALGKQYVILG